MPPSSSWMYTFEGGRITGYTAFGASAASWVPSGLLIAPAAPFAMAAMAQASGGTALVVGSVTYGAAARSQATGASRQGRLASGSGQGFAFGYGGR